MAHSCRCLLLITLAAICGAPVFASPHEINADPAAVAGAVPSGENGFVAGRGGRAVQIAPSEVGGVRFFHSYGIGTYESPLGFGGRIAIAISPWLNLRAGASFFSYSTTRKEGTVPFTANVRFQSDEAQVDWYPFHGGFHVSPGVMLGNSSRLYGSALIPAGNSFSLNGVTYYSAAADPVHASGSVRFRRTAPMATVGWGNWVRREREAHWAFPFEMGAVFWGNPKTVMNFAGEVCTDASQLLCRDVTKDPSVQANINVERRKLQNGANWLKIYPVIAGGVVYRF